MRVATGGSAPRDGGGAFPQGVRAIKLDFETPSGTFQILAKADKIGETDGGLRPNEYMGQSRRARPHCLSCFMAEIAAAPLPGTARSPTGAE